MINLGILAVVPGLVLGLFLPGWLWNVEHGRCSRAGILPIPDSLWPAGEAGIASCCISSRCPLVVSWQVSGMLFAISITFIHPSIPFSPKP